jgi:Domain of unknown function (DUF4190)
MTDQNGGAQGGTGGWSEPTAPGGSGSIPPPEPGFGQAPGYGQGGYSQPGYGQSPGYGPPPAPPGYPSSYPQSGYGQYGGGYGPVGPQRTNGFAIASLILSIAGFLFGLGGVLGIIFGFIARSQINRSGGAQKGSGIATAGIIIGFAVVALYIIIIAVVVSGHCGTSGHPACRS